MLGCPMCDVPCTCQTTQRPTDTMTEIWAVIRPTLQFRTGILFGSDDSLCKALLRGQRGSAPLSLSGVMILETNNWRREICSLHGVWAFCKVSRGVVVVGLSRLFAVILFRKEARSSQDEACESVIPMEQLAKIFRRRLCHAVDIFGYRNNVFGYR